MGIWTPRAKPEVCKFTYTPTTRCLNLFKLCALYGLYGALYGNEVFNLFKPGKPELFFLAVLCTI